MWGGVDQNQWLVVDQTQRMFGVDQNPHMVVVDIGPTPQMARVDILDARIAVGSNVGILIDILLGGFVVNTNRCMPIQARWYLETWVGAQCALISREVQSPRLAHRE